MSFKVVFIKETQEIEPIPAKWEENGILHWPPDEKIRKKLQSNELSAPSKNWDKYHCVVKTQNILVYGDASAEAKWYIENTTEDECDYKHRNKNPARRLQQQKKKCVCRSYNLTICFHRQNL